MDAVDIQRKYLQRERTRCEVYQKILEKCFRRIEIAVEQGITNFVFDIPPWSWGLPRYSMPDAAAYIKETLEKKGYRVEYAGTHYSLLVDWSEYLPEPKQVREMVRWEGNTKWKQPRNRIKMPTVSSWILDQPIRFEKPRNFIPLPSRSKPSKQKTVSLPPDYSNIPMIAKPNLERQPISISERPQTPQEEKTQTNTFTRTVSVREQPQTQTQIMPMPSYPNIRENVAPPRSHLFIPPPQMSREQSTQQPSLFIAPPQQTQPFMDRPQQASRQSISAPTTHVTVKEMLEKPSSGQGRKIKIEW